MKKQLIISLILILFIIPFSVSAIDYPQPYNQYVNDYANVFSSQENYYLQSLFANVEQNTTAQVVVVTIDSLNGSDISQYATDLGQNWGIGTKEKDNGLLILYSKTENKIFVATGYGLEGILPDSKVGRLLDENYVPLRDSGNVSSGIIAFSNAVSDVLIQNGDEIRAKTSGGSLTNGISIVAVIIFLLVAFLIIALIIYPFMSRKKKSFSDFMMFFFIDFLVRIIIYSIIFRGGGRSSGSGGFGGGGFGGGSFGGGGAGR